MVATGALGSGQLPTTLCSVSGMVIEAEEDSTQRLPVWTLKRVVSSPSSLAIAGFAPVAIAVTNAWIVTKRSPELTLSLLGAIPIGSLVASTAIPVLALLAVVVLGMSAVGINRLSPTLFWICAVLATLAYPLIAAPMVVSLAIASYVNSFNDRAGRRMGQLIQRLHDINVIYLTATAVFLPGIIALNIRDYFLRGSNSQAALTLEAVGGVSIVSTVGIVFLASLRERRQGLRREARLFGLGLVGMMFLGSFSFAASNMTWGAREAVSWTSEDGEAMLVGRVISVDDTGMRMMSDGGIISFVKGGEITDRVMCPHPIDLNAGSSVAEVFGRLLDGADYRAYENRLCS